MAAELPRTRGTDGNMVGVLSKFEFQVQHRSGQKHTNADALSCSPCHQCGLTDDPATGDSAGETATQHCSMLQEDWLHSWSPLELRDQQMSDPDLQQMISWKEESTPDQCPSDSSRVLQSLWAQRQQLVMHNGVLHIRGEDVPNYGAHKRLQPVLPRVLIPTVLQEVHNAPTGGHLGVTKTLEKARRFYWVGQRQDVEDWCCDCSMCVSRKSPLRTCHALMQVETARRPMQRIAMNILGPLPNPSRLNKYVLVISDYFTKRSKALPCLIKKQQQWHTCL